MATTVLITDKWRFFDNRHEWLRCAVDAAAAVIVTYCHSNTRIDYVYHPRLGWTHVLRRIRRIHVLDIYELIKFISNHPQKKFPKFNSDTAYLLIHL